MISFLYDYVTHSPESLKSEALINQLNLIERKANGTISAKSGSHDDLFMAASLCAYVKKLSSLEIEPLLGVNTQIQIQQNTQKIKNVIGFSNFKQSKVSGISISYNREEHGIEYNIMPNNDEDEDYDDQLVSIF